MLQFDAGILSNRTIAPDWKELILRWNPGAGRPEPGHFLTLRPGRGSDPLLRRPFAVASYEEGDGNGPSASIVYQIRGQGTRLLADLLPGATVDVLGPLGKPFPLPVSGESPILAAGGVGLGPVLYLARRLEELRTAAGGAASAAGAVPHPAAVPADAAPANAAPAPFVIGFRSVALVPDLPFPPGLVLCTDDGSAGFRGTPVDWIAHNAPSGATRLYACGPSPMLAAIARLAAGRGWQASLSAEQWMACGVGACMGCVLPRPVAADGAPQGFLRACADGPVFELGDIDWEKT